MPLDNDGNYVPIDDTSKQLISQYLQDLVRQGKVTQQNVIELVGQRFGVSAHLDNSDILPVRGLLGGAQKAVATGQQMRDDPNYIPPAGDIPSAPSDPANRGLYVYDVVIIATDPNTGDTFRDRVEIVSNSILNERSILATVQGNREYYLRRLRSPNPDPRLIPSLEIDVFIMDVSRGQ